MRTHTKKHPKIRKANPDNQGEKDLKEFTNWQLIITPGFSPFDNALFVLCGETVVIFLKQLNR